MYGGEQLEAEQRVYIYVQQPKRYKTPEDISAAMTPTRSKNTPMLWRSGAKQ